MGTYHRRRPSKRDLPDKNPYTLHEIQDESTINRDWKSINEITVLSIDPGVTNFGLRIEKRPFGSDVWKVKVKSYSNTCFKDYQTNPETNTSALYRSISEYLDSFKSKLLKAHLILIERQLPINYNMVRVSQHIISYLITILSKSEIHPLILEIDSSGKTCILGAPKKLTPRQVKDWSVEKALQLSYIRKDWHSFYAIINATRNKTDDLSDVMVQIESICSLFDWGTTPIPPDWEILPIMSGWETGQIFFRHLLKLMDFSPQYLTTITKLKGWLKLLRGNYDLIVRSRDRLLAVQQPKIVINLGSNSEIIEKDDSIETQIIINF